MLLYEDIARKNGYRDDFIQKVRLVARRIGIRASWLMALMKSESGINHLAFNPSSGATGLIQIIPSTAQKLGTSTQELRSMSAVRQLDFVEKFYESVKGKIKRPADLYVFTFGPAFINSGSSAVMARGDSAEFHGGKYGKDGILTKGEFKRYVNETRFKDIPYWEKYPNRTFFFVLLLIIIIYFIIIQSKS